MPVHRVDQVRDREQFSHHPLELSGRGIGHVWRAAADQTAAQVAAAIDG
jgi:hypothetical protein